MSFRLVPKSVTLNDLERHNGRYFALLHRIFVYDVVVKQLLVLPRFQNVLLIVCDHIKTICAIIQRLFGQNKPITRLVNLRLHASCNISVIFIFNKKPKLTAAEIVQTTQRAFPDKTASRNPCPP